MADMKDLLQQLDSWMEAYMTSFYTDDTVIQQAILIKQKHTGCVKKISRALAEHLGLSAHDVTLAEIMGLLHDVGRFRQFTLYQTFNDALSEDHAALGWKVLQDMPLLRELSRQDREWLCFAIQNHNKKAIAPTQDAQGLLFARLLRDADKLDIYRVLEPYIAPSDGSGFSPHFLEQFLAARQCDYTQIRTQDDRKLVRLMWLYDVNFSWTLQRIVARGYVDKIIACLPEDELLAAGIKHLRDYLADKCAATDRVNFA
jgi:hypothetical protein